MKFLIDESSDARLADYLRSLGHEATLVAQTPGQGSPDLEILQYASLEGYVMVTDDRDFGELVYQKREPHQGVVYFRLRDTVWQNRRDRMAYVLERHADDLDRFLVVTDSRVRTGAPPKR